MLVQKRTLVACSIRGVVLSSLACLGLGACSRQDAEPVTLAQSSQPLSVAAKAIGTDPPVPIQYNTGAYLGVASDGTNSTVVFYDGGKIRGVRYDEAGTVLDVESWIQLGFNGDTGPTQAYADVAFGGGVFLAVYDVYSDVDNGVYAQAFDASGAILSEPVLVGPAGYYGSVVFNGADFTVAWYGGDMGLVRVALDGSIVAGSAASVTSGSTTNRPSVAMSGATGLVVFEQLDTDIRSVYAARFDAAATVLDPGGILISNLTTSSSNVAVAAGTDGFLAVWKDTASDTVMGSLIDLSGNVVSRELTISRSTAAVTGCAVAFDGTQYLVVWQDMRDTEAAIYGTRISAAGEHVDAADVALATGSRVYQASDIDLAWGNGRYSLAYVGNGIEGRFLDSNLTQLAPGALELSPLPNPQLSPKAIWNGSEYLLTWSDERDPNAYQLRATRIDAGGSVLTPAGIPISPASHDAAWVNVAYNGQTTLFSWRDFGDTVGAYKATLAADGSANAPELWVSALDSGGQIVSNGETFLGSYSAGDNGAGNDNEIWLQAFDAAGAASGAALNLVTISRPRWLLDGFAGEYLLAYSGQEIDGTPITGSVLTVSAAGAITGEYEAFQEGMLSASLGTSPDQALVGWQDATTQGLFGSLFTKAEGFGAAFAITDLVADAAPGIAWDGSKFIVVWAEDRTALWSCEVAPDGTVTTPELLFTGDFGWVSLTAGADGQLLLSYVRWLEYSRSRRIESRLVGDLVPAGGSSSGGSGGASSGAGGSSSSGAGGSSGGGSVGGSGGSSSSGAGGSSSSGAGGSPSGGSAAASGGVGSNVGGSSPSTGGGTSSATGGVSGSGGAPAVTTATGGTGEAAAETGGAAATAVTGDPGAAGSATDSAGAPSDVAATEAGASAGAAEADPSAEQSANSQKSGSSDDGGCSVGGRGRQTGGYGWLPLLAFGVAIGRRRRIPRQ